ncbi:MAG TPA: cytochrome C biogenesis protein [Gammaproteobacteria bacterium]|jgi:curved DNA-binding protein|nr:cytochrome C biogenesis protein [Gammaproteobacteria bacterium]
MKFEDYYKMLGVERDASQDEIKKAYRRLARKYHPDVSKERDAEERFKEIGEAYEVLRDDEKRAAYDQLGPNWKQGQDFTPPPGWGDGANFSGGFSGGGGASAFSDFFESMFGRATGQSGFHSSDFGGHAGGFGGQAQSARGQDQHASIQIDIEDSYQGASKTLTLKGSGQAGADQPRKLKVRIPKGVREGQKIRLAGQGGAGVGQASAGDLQLEVHFRPHRWYRVDSSDVYMDLPLTPWEAALGATIDVPTPEGRVGVKIPPGAEQGKKLRLRGRGLPGRQAGDFYVVLQLTLPKADSPQAEALYARMQEELAYNPRKDLY